ncbi:aspartate/glutamate racemase family protein [Sagittula salina]|uniref:Uncharacterized protein n=1 Tax=Sagittula salina TaxID=2820268 RepID=A0A940MLX3_9RHOB|nr:aspartate/glutamate racemase family protein [Sagittula salina]MBP0483911.1 hypothetical protein [Sagittula salina]
MTVYPINPISTLSMTRWHGRELPLEGCSDDTALPRHSGPCPVRWSVSGSTACHHCAPRCRRYNVVTTLAVSVRVIDANIRGFGLNNLLDRVRASGIPVLALDAAPDAAPDAACAGIPSEAPRAVAEDRFDAVVLGCVGMLQVARISGGTARPGHRPGRRRLGCKAADRHPDRLIHGARRRAPYRENTAGVRLSPKNPAKNNPYVIYSAPAPINFSTDSPVTATRSAAHAEIERAPRRARDRIPPTREHVHTDECAHTAPVSCKKAP